MRSSLLHNIAVSRRFTTNLIVRLASTRDFKVLSTAVNKASLAPSKELHLRQDQALKLMKLLLGLPESDDYWNKPFQNNLYEALEVNPCISNAVRFYKHFFNSFHALFLAYVDENLHGGIDTYSRLSEKTEETFEFK